MRHTNTMHFRTASLLTLSIALCVVGCDSTSPAARDDGAGPEVIAPEPPPGPGSSARSNAGGGASDDGVRAQQAPTQGHEPSGPSPAAGATTTAPLVCPTCQSNPGGQTGDFGGGLMEAPCPMPDRLLDAALAQRFRIDEVRAAATRSFSQAMTWGAVEDDGAGLRETWSDTTLDGELTVGDFVYEPCHDAVIAAASLHFSTQDGKLETTLRGEIGLRAHQLGWPAGEQPVIQFNGSSDLSDARGTFDLGVDPSKPHAGELGLWLTAVGEEVHGAVRVRLHEYPDEAGRLAAQHPSDTPGPVKIHERGAAYFPFDECQGQGRRVAIDAALPELGGGSGQALFARVEPLLGAAHPFDATWLDGSAARGIIELGDPTEEVCVGTNAWEDPWFVRFDGEARGRSEDGTFELTLPWFEVAVDPYSSEARYVGSQSQPLNDPAIRVLWPHGMAAPSEGWISDAERGRQLAWPPCTHSEVCDLENVADNAP